MVHSNPAFNEFTAIEASITAFIETGKSASQTCNQEKACTSEEEKKDLSHLQERRHQAIWQQRTTSLCPTTKNDQKKSQDLQERISEKSGVKLLNALKSFVHPIPTPLKHQDEATRRTYGRSSASSGAGPAGAGAARDLGRTLPGAGMSRPHADKEFKYVIKVKSIVGLGKQLALYRYRRWHESRSRSETNVTFKLLFLL
ncbi:hypothetical protein PSTT_12206 [Puccinia striiformis]|nr:hypothetical protein PSTT_12206 [Puccinia striiformis]